ncbi:cysteine protease PalB [Histoplasma capsulatum var. duboisii H88]|uniref:Cysteine protease PalB n=1 Tax=Ajellomyces capsulatus (strain H88) TaxID=544711 RepID=A0A8A1LWQ4_AJEC8|nr:cysteine protease PalB [Histoplasma capsulatum var. duboisii H88]
MPPLPSKLGELEIQARKAEKDVSKAATQRAALDAAISAVENYLKALTLASSPSEKQRLDAKCKELLRKAEDIKKSEFWNQHLQTRTNTSNSSSRVRPRLREPVSTRNLSNREQIILLEDSKLNGYVFPPWSAVPDAGEFELEEDGDQFTDSCDLPLSELQCEIFNGWKRPADILGAGVANDYGKSHTLVMKNEQPIDLVQDVTTDCSVVASLCAIISQVQRGYSKVFAIKSYPSEEQTFNPKISQSGKYIFQMHFNGCYRKVVIDDHLPSSKTSRFLHVIDRQNPALLWPALAEKAYLKVRGGYDFPGSNSGTDLWILTGWIPEQIFLHDEDVISDQLWKRLFNAFNYGDVLITVGTGSLAEQEEEELGLVNLHDYAILDMKEDNSRRQFLVKNPWAAGSVWEGIGQSHLPDTEGASEYKHDQHQIHRPLSPGTFWTDCDKLLQNFENLYLNWNPTLFPYRQDIHFTWDLSSASSVPGCFAENPQFAVGSKAGGSVWLLLSRHFNSGDYTRPGKQLIDVSSERDEPGFISIYVFKKGGQRVCVSDGALGRGAYVDSPNTLMRFEMPPNTVYTVVAAEQSLRRSSQNFSLSGFSTAPLSISHATERYGYVKKLPAAWTTTTAGGNADSPKYPANPQFRIDILEACDIAIILETANPELATHVKIVCSDGKRVSSVRSRDVAFDSGDYRRGCSFAEHSDLARGSYTAVCSTFAPDQLGKFSLWIKTTKSCNLKPLPAEGAGQLSTLSDIGRFPPGTDRILAPITTSRLARITAIVRHKGSWAGARSVAPSPILMTLELGQGPYKDILASSGDGSFSNAVSGIRIEEFDLQPGFERQGGLWLVVERVGGPGGQVHDTIELEILSEERVTIGPWGVGNG